MTLIPQNAFVDPRPFGLPEERRDTLGRRINAPPEFTLDQMERIKQYYLETPPLEFDLYKLAAEIGKSRQNICRFAKLAGLTNKSRPATSRQVAAVKKPKWQNKPHPRGMAGKQHSDVTKAVLSDRSKRMWATQRAFGGNLVSEEATARRSAQMAAWQASRPASANYTNRNGGHRADLGGQYFRSSWEANYARYLNLLISLGVVEKWDYEPEVFWFEGIRRGTTNYKPDFRIKYRGDKRFEYVEIKGWIVPKDRVKWARMRKFHPQIRLIIVKSKEYYNIQRKWASVIAEWEHPKRQQSRIRANRSLHNAAD